MPPENVNKMTTYEIITIIIAIIALVQPWAIALCRKFFSKAEVSFIPSAKIKLYYNRSGAYIYLGGVIESKHKSTIVKNISVKLIRQNDKAELMMDWSSFITPIFQSVGGNPVTTSEIARPFMVEANSLAPVFIEFANSDTMVNDRLCQIYEILINESKSIANIATPFEQAKTELQSKEKYLKLHEELIENFYWKATDYCIEMSIKYNDEQVIIYKYKFSLSQNEASQLKENIDKSMLYEIYRLYCQPINVGCLQKDFINLEE